MLKKHFKALVVVLIVGFIATGCASTAKMIDHATLQTKVKLSEPIFLSLATAERTAYVKVTNTSDVQNIPLETALKDNLTKKGITLIDDPTKATWIIQANLTSLVYNKVASMGEDASRAGVVLGGVSGGVLAGTSRDTWFGAAVGTIAGSIVGGITGALAKVESYTGTVDLQIQERVSGGVRGTMKTEAKQGTATTLATEREVVSDFQTYRTFMTVEATRTNINLDEAVVELSTKIADQIAGLF